MDLGIAHTFNLHLESQFNSEVLDGLRVNEFVFRLNCTSGSDRSGWRLLSCSRLQLSLEPGDLALVLLVECLEAVPVCLLPLQLAHLLLEFLLKLRDGSVQLPQLPILLS
jgi:hypothetical protein